MAIDFSKTEAKWQSEWEKHGLAYAKTDKKKKKFFLIFAYPGMSGFLHVGHMRGFTYADVITRYKRMQGFNVLFPAGFHASGLPAVAYASKIKKKDPDTIEQLKAYGLNDKQIGELEKPENVVAFFSKVYVNDFWKPFGFLIDWNRTISTIAPEYNRFIEWQFKKLYQKKLLVQKPHYAPNCPVDGPVAIDTSETDISSGGNATTLEYTIVKFKYQDFILPCATLRPETVYGVTNLWLNPDTTLVECNYQNEKWLLTKEAAEKLAYQKPGFKVGTKTISSRELIGKKCKNLANQNEVLILPSGFVDAGTGTGVVMSVPSHAPFDWIALVELQKNAEQLKAFGISKSQIDSIQPISLINTTGFGAHAAIEQCQKRGITSLSQEKELEEATQAVYSAEFHGGKLNSVYGKLQGTPVHQAKDKIIEEFKQKRIADEMLGFSEKVICRCGREIVFKHVPDQWFIKYSDETLTASTVAHANKMKIWPEEYQRQLPGVLEWFSDRACVRQGSWMGTKFPFDQKWIIEPISDSTLYPLTYLFSNYVNEKKLIADNLTEEFFDFVYLGKGESPAVSKQTGVSKALLEQIQSDVAYWYPLDVNLGGKEHKTVHFPVFLMNHIGVLPQKMWPNGIFVNWWVVGETGKISKSKGGAVSLHDLASRFSIDALRLYYCNVGNPHADIVFSEDTAQKYKNTLERNLQLVEKCLSMPTTTSTSKTSAKHADALTKKNASGGVRPFLDSWLSSKTNQTLTQITSAFENNQIKEASELVYYTMANDLKSYFQRGGSNSKQLREIIDQWVVVMAPVTPHLAEEIWHSLLKQKSLVSTEHWKLSKEKIDESVLQAEQMISQLLEDVAKIRQIAKIDKPKQITLYPAPEWKWKALKFVLEQNPQKPDFKKTIGEFSKNPEFKPHMADAAQFIQKVLGDLGSMRELKKFNETKILEEEKTFLEQSLGCKIKIEPNSTAPKAQKAFPQKPAIQIE